MGYEIKIIPGPEVVRYYLEDETLFDRIKYLHPNEVYHETHLFAFDGEHVVGDVGLQNNPYDDSEIWFKHVSVDSEHRNKGVATALIAKSVDYVLSQKKHLGLSSFSDEGELYIKKIFRQIHEDHPNLLTRNSAFESLFEYNSPRYG